MDTLNLLDRRLGMIAISKGYATRQEVDRALLEQQCVNADEKISAHLSQDPISSEPWMIAEGQKFRAMKISEVKCYFGSAAITGNLPDNSGAAGINRQDELSDEGC